MDEDLNQQQNYSDNKYKKAEYVLAGLAIGFILAVTGIFLWNNFQKTGGFIRSEKGNEQDISEAEYPMSKEEKKLAVSDSEAKEESGEAECGEWEKYTNTDVGYSLCIPKDWTVKETNRMSPVTSGIVKYINIYSPDKRYDMHLGFKKAGDDFRLGDRTGIGAGDDKKIGEITVLGKIMSVDGHYFEGEIREVFFKWMEIKWNGEKYETQAFFNRDGGDTYDPGKGINKDDPALTDAKKIYESLRVTDGSGTPSSSGCPSTLTESEKSIMKNWKTYTDKNNKFSLMHPEGTEVFRLDDDVLNFNEKDGSTLFSMRSNAQAAADFNGYKITSQTMVKVDCIDTVKLVMATDLENFPKSEKRKMISTQIDREHTRQRLEMNFPDMHSASLESDYFETYDMVLKSIKFNP